MDLLFIVNSMLLGVGLAMDAFSVSISNGMVYPDMERWKKWLTAGTFSLFQFLMPMIGWFFVRFASGFSESFRKCIPWIALILLLYIGGNMLAEGIRDRKKSGKESEEEEEGTGITVSGTERLTLKILVIQGIATSIDAFSVGFTIAGYHTLMALTAALIIGGVTFVICLAGVRIGQVLGDVVGSKASVLGGLILIGIGIEIFIKNIFL